MIEATYSFPRGFLWGSATSSHQVEGDNRNNDWWAWEQQPGRIHQGDTSGKACDWWGGRWQEDFDRAAQGGQNAHRLSIEWSRVEPDPAMWDESALEAYRAMVQGARARGLLPLVTLHHFTNPLWVAEQGGWLNPAIVPLFERYTRKVVAALADLVDLWVTINEPNVLATMGHALGVFPPGEKDIGRTLRAGENMARAHAAAYHAIHALQPSAQVGVAHHYRGYNPANPRSPLDRWAAATRARTVNDMFPRAFADGILRTPFGRKRIPQAAGTQDFFGLNYYTVERIAFDARRPGELFARGFYPPGSDLSTTGFLANVPEGFFEALTWARAFGLPIHVTENGVEDRDDRMRPRYLATHIRQLWRAVNFNWPVRSYFHWSLVDNFEWERGWSQRFGLWGLDPQTQARSKRPSADLYAAICRANALSSETVAAFAPEALPAVFPGAMGG